MDVVIESTKSFEKDLGELGKEEKATAIKTINDCVSLFPTQKTAVYHKLRRLPLPSDINGYESSLFTLRVSDKLRIILTIDEDPIFDRVIFTLFRLFKRADLGKAYKGVAESLYQELLHHNRETAQIS
ncbi:hypothetical protein Sta7437_1329 [Stanieria cyanosphaera PCC 7437]|uniref:Uncharacterized protein n=1 Tax=Stanieria cyanosphaera (strain ATCC 29371 / PCC 7437) TaxID=111780 RepID=K9XS61_STAC7|nr:hypothetical protein [Stanieria cyanosphaera]AFZ34896.1 hypothetical protein Sta7437_1329 [Stanieria cyanosphaera PCC 7437]